MIRAALFVTLTVTMVTSSAVGASGPVFQGDLQVVHEVKAVYQKMASTHTWRARTRSAGAGGQGTSTFEFVAPDRFHITMSQGGRSSEMFKVGQDLWTMSGGACRKMPASIPVPDPRSLPALGTDTTITVARGGPAMVDGTPTQTYLLNYEIHDKNKNTLATSQEKLYVAAGTGLPRRAERTFSGGTSTTDYYDYNAPITINNPPC